ncbi:type I-E CRISPR-associated endoribonuclease Cas2 [Gordonia sihwensis]|uniref:type I-E CRISPR-associated endoribonuclease Cas2 n=1 Tax=Gordonia sihwensis TaxID=173559 RepID=UPI0005EDA871|nr:type I-E CRISPR-associated endoribonuclease Cas2 [Gordonia sihwensis]KJR10505.1 hypothetical protein UG54_00470 [Gordonia sihwensis]
MALLVITVVNNTALRGWLQRWCTHIGDGGYVTDLSARVREELLTHLHNSTPPGHYTAVWADPRAPQGWTTESNAQPHATDTLDGITLSI